VAPDRADLLATLATEHRSLDAEAARLLEGVDERWSRRLDGFLRDLATHEVAEEQLVLPLVRRRLERGHELATYRDAERAIVLTLAERLRRARPDDEAVAMMEELRRRFGEHCDREEIEVFPALRHVVAQEELAELWQRYRVLTRQVPTRCSPDPDRDGHPLAEQVRRISFELLDETVGRAAGGRG
jgi:hemerythrin superfamily protein